MYKITMPVHHSPKGLQKGKGKAGVSKTPTKSCVMDSVGNILITVDMISTDNTVEQHSAKAAACHKAECEIEKVAAQQKDGTMRVTWKSLTMMDSR